MYKATVFLLLCLKLSILHVSVHQLFWKKYIYTVFGQAYVLPTLLCKSRRWMRTHIIKQKIEQYKQHGSSHLFSLFILNKHHPQLATTPKPAALATAGTWLYICQAATWLATKTTSQMCLEILHAQVKAPRTQVKHHKRYWTHRERLHAQLMSLWNQVQHHKRHCPLTATIDPELLSQKNKMETLKRSHKSSSA